MTYKHWIAIALVPVMGAVLIVAIPIMMLLRSGSDASTSCGGPAVMPPAGAEVAPTDPSVLAGKQTEIVRTIIAVGEQMGFSDQGIIVALSTASQESGFKNYANDGTGILAADQMDVGKSLNYPHDAIGNDHGSVNPFQQQYPWWGTMDELMNPQIAAIKFYEALKKVPGWEALPVTVAAQKVQVSLYPDAYADDEIIARRLYAENKGASKDAPALPPQYDKPVSGGPQDVGDSPINVGDSFELDVADVLCGGGAAMDCAPTNNPAEKGLTPDALRVMRCITETFGERPWANVGDRPSGVDRDHQEGCAVDAMMTEGDDDYRTPAGRAKGDAIADFVVKNADALGVKYVIWYEKIWTRSQDAVGQPGSWGPYDYPLGGNSTDTVAHRDHVHVSVYGNSAIAAPGAGAVGDGNARLPVDPGKYTITSGYGYRSNPTGTGGQMHAGLDFGAASGTPIFAVTGGTVTQASNVGDGYGNCVVITTGNTETRYAHQVDGAIKVKVGDQVSAGTEIGGVGTTGDSTGDHLHFEVRVDGKSTDPMPYLQNMGLTP